MGSAKSVHEGGECEVDEGTEVRREVKVDEACVSYTSSEPRRQRQGAV
jgi:hypothetical protein